MRWRQEYISGQHVWDEDIHVPSGTDGATVMQVLRVKRPAGTRATDFMINVFDRSGVHHHGNGCAEARFRNVHYWTR
jgi:hypothetical protein